MTLPASGTIRLLAVQSEFSGSSNNLYAYRAGGGIVAANTQNGAGYLIPSGPPLSMSNFYGANSANQLSRLYVSPGSYTETSPITGNVTIQIWGGGAGGGYINNISESGSGGGAGGYSRTDMTVTAGQTFACNVGNYGHGAPNGSSGNGTAGTQSNVSSSGMTTMIANGGGAGQGSQSAGGAGGTASGGTTVNQTGGAGTNSYSGSTVMGGGKSNSATSALYTHYGVSWGANNTSGSGSGMPGLGGGGGDGKGNQQNVYAGDGSYGAVYFIYRA